MFRSMMGIHIRQKAYGAFRISRLALISPFLPSLSQPLASHHRFVFFTTNCSRHVRRICNPFRSRPLEYGLAPFCSSARLFYFKRKNENMNLLLKKKKKWRQKVMKIKQTFEIYDLEDWTGSYTAWVSWSRGEKIQPSLVTLGLSRRTLTGT